MSKVTCRICPHACSLEKGQIGICRARSNHNDSIRCDNYGKVTSVSLDPIEKKPLLRFSAGSNILSVGSYGCNLRCSFCQNYTISMADDESSQYQYITPEELVKRAVQLVPMGNIGIAFTYNEPFIGFEYVMDCAVLAKQKDLQIVLVTNGYVNEAPLREILPYVDAMNIDLKGFTEAFYRSIGGGLEAVKRSIEIAVKECHVEVTTLIIPDENDSEEEMHALAGWLASVDKDIPLHIARFFPRYQMLSKHATSVETIYKLSNIARRYLTTVFEGNM